jgi:hypothetical protein
MHHAKALPTAGHAGEKLLGFHCPVFQRLGITAIVAAIALPRKRFAKIAELNLPTTNRTFGVIKHLPQLLASNLLLLFVRLLLNDVVD